MSAMSAARAAEVFTGKPLTRPEIASSKWKSSAADISRLVSDRVVCRAARQAGGWRGWCLDVLV